MNRWRVWKVVGWMLVCASVAWGGRLELEHVTPEKIEYYGSEYAYPPLTVELAAGSPLSEKIEQLLASDGWLLLGPASGIPDIRVIGAKGAYTMNISKWAAGINVKPATSGWPSRVKMHDPSVYEEIKSMILALVEQQKDGPSRRGDRVLFPAESEPYVPEDPVEAIWEEMTREEEALWLQGSYSEPQQVELVDQLIERALANPDYPRSLKKKLKKDADQNKARFLQASELLQQADLDGKAFRIDWADVATRFVAERPWEGGWNQQAETPASEEQKTSWSKRLLLWGVSLVVLGVLVRRVKKWLHRRASRWSICNGD